jgi:hypothetical protein
MHREFGSGSDRFDPECNHAVAVTVEFGVGISAGTKKLPAKIQGAMRLNFADDSEVAADELRDDDGGCI